MILGVDIDQRAASESREQQSSSSGWAPRLTGRVRALQGRVRGVGQLPGGCQGVLRRPAAGELVHEPARRRFDPGCRGMSAGRVVYAVKILMKVKPMPRAPAIRPPRLQVSFMLRR